MKNLRIGVVGVGPHAVRSVDGFNQVDEIDITVICDLDENRAEVIAQQFEGARATTDHRDVVADADVDLVYVATPPRWHRGVTLDVLRAGKHVLCEKPMALTVAEAIEMRDASHAAGVIHAVGHHSRYLARYRHMHQLVAHGYVGDTRLVSVVIPANYATDPKRTPFYAHPINERSEGGGMVFGNLSHYIDLLCYIFGDITVEASVSGIGVPLRPVFTGPQHEVNAGGPAAMLDSLPVAEVHGEDAIVIGATLATGGLLSLASGWSLHHPGDHAWDIYGSEGTLQFRKDVGYSAEGDLLGARRDEPEVVRLDLPAEFATDEAPHTQFGRDLVARFNDPHAEVTYATFDDALRTQQIIDQLTSTVPKRS